MYPPENKTMNYIDVFNGDADGLCALHQLRLAEPVPSRLVTGPKREIALVRRVQAAAGDRVTVLDVALEKNIDAVNGLLAAGVQVRYFDHHRSGPLPHHAAFEAHIDTRAEVCTSLLVNDQLQGRHLPWAVVAAFGDNLADSARSAATPLGLQQGRLDALRELGEALNYNGYGESLEDLHFAPDDLYRRMQPFADPFAFMAEDAAFATLREGYVEDMARARAVAPADARPAARIYLLPAEKWARRISGVFGNVLANEAPHQAHAVLTAKPDGGYVVSVRAPLDNRRGADELCARFPTGGGRQGAAGINHLPEDALAAFVAAFFTAYP